MGTASVHVNRIVKTPSTSVMARRSFKRSVTGTRKSSDTPRSQRTNPQIHLRYWTVIGWSIPYWLLSASSSPSLTKVPCDFSTAT